MPTKTVFITGSSRGLGLAFAKYYTKAGWNVIATTRKDSNTQHLEALSPFKMLTIDVQDEPTVLAAAKQLKDIPIDLLINNAGICTDGDSMTSTSKENMMKECCDCTLRSLSAVDTYRGARAYCGVVEGAWPSVHMVYSRDMIGRLPKIYIPDWLRVEFEVHAVGPLLVTRALLPNLRLAAKGTRNCVHVVQLSTIYASIESGGGPTAYCTSKTALHMVNRSMANELEHDNIAVILLDPGMIYTNMPLSSYEREATKVVAEMANVIEDTTIEDTGKFMDYDGMVLPW